MTPPPLLRTNGCVMSLGRVFILLKKKCAKFNVSQWCFTKHKYRTISSPGSRAPLKKDFVVLSLESPTIPNTQISQLQLTITPHYLAEDTTMNATDVSSLIHNRIEAVKNFGVYNYSSSVLQAVTSRPQFIQNVWAVLSKVEQVYASLATNNDRFNAMVILICFAALMGQESLRFILLLLHRWERRGFTVKQVAIFAFVFCAIATKVREDSDFSFERDLERFFAAVFVVMLAAFCVVPSFLRSIRMSAESCVNLVLSLTFFSFGVFFLRRYGRDLIAEGGKRLMSFLDQHGCDLIVDLITSVVDPITSEGRKSLMSNLTGEL